MVFIRRLLLQWLVSWCSSKGLLLQASHAQSRTQVNGVHPKTTNAMVGIMMFIQRTTTTNILFAEVVRKPKVCQENKEKE
ncbi:hypothetical protein BDA99DRAFT_510746, partial [Phascolomyces articulosus]